MRGRDGTRRGWEEVGDGSTVGSDGTEEEKQARGMGTDVHVDQGLGRVAGWKTDGIRTQGSWKARNREGLTDVRVRSAEPWPRRRSYVAPLCLREPHPSRCAAVGCCSGAVVLILSFCSRAEGVNGIPSTRTGRGHNLRRGFASGSSSLWLLLLLP